MTRLLEPYATAYPDDGLCQRWALLMSATRRAGRPLPFADLWIAATALHLSLPLVTHNPRDFRGIVGLAVVSEAPDTP